MYLGVKAVIAKSLERIHKANLVNFGILPLIFTNEGDYDDISQGDELEIHSVRNALSGTGNKLKVMNKTDGTEFEVKYELSQLDKEKILAGGTLNVIAKKKGE